MDNRLTHRYFPAVLLVTAAIFALAYESYPVQIAKATGLSVSETARLTRFQNKTIKVIKQGFGQKERQLGFGFVVENPNAGLLIEGSQYQIAAYDAEGTVVKTESGYIDILLPSQKLGVGGTMFLDEGVTVSKIEVQISDGKTTASDPVSTFVVDAVTYTSGQFSSQATGIVSNPYKSDITELRVSSVAYDAAGDIIGGGFTFLNFVLANGKTGIKVPVTSAKKVALVELYPIVSSLSLLNTEE